MGKICVLKIANVEPALPAPDRGSAPAQPVSLLAFLQAENLKLQSILAQLERETTTLREALQRTHQSPVRISPHAW
jgi:hypothetical protein